MKLKPLDKIEGSDLLALPADPEQLRVIAQLTLGASGGDYTNAKAPTNAEERESLWRRLNESVAVAGVDDDETDDLARLEAALGLVATSTEPQHPAEIERRRIAARHIARAKCRALLEAGYQP